MKNTKIIFEAEAVAHDAETVNFTGTLNHLPPAFQMMFGKMIGATKGVAVSRKALVDILTEMLEQVAKPLEPGQELTIDLSAFHGGTHE